MADSTAQSRSQRPNKKVSEATRERETFRYEPSLTANFPIHDTGDPIPDDNLKTSSQTVLTALAQLALYQTGGERAFISLFDTKYQYIVAEATKATPLTPDLSSRSCPDPLTLCGHAIPRSHGVCEYILAAADEPLADNSQKLPVTVVENLAAQEILAARPECKPSSDLPFYAGVPIRTIRGINIGAFSVLASQTDLPWSENASRSLREVSRGIMEHLEGTRANHAYRRNERVSRGFGSFMEAKSTLSGWRFGPNTHAFENTASSEGRLDTQQQHLEKQTEMYNDELENKTEFASESNGLAHRQKPTASSDGNLPESTSFPFNVDRSPSVPFGSSKQSSLPTARASDPAQQSEQGSLEAKRASLYSRAANIIRESFEVEGCIYLDVTFGSYRTPNTKANTDVEHSRKPPLETSSSSDEQFVTSPIEVPDASCGVLGFSTSDRSSINSSKIAQDEILLPKRFLAKLLRRYPKGKIFNFDALGELQSSDSSDDGHSDANATAGQTATPSDSTTRARSDKKQSARQEEGAMIYDRFKGARSIIFIPMWDSKRDRWFAGNFIYTHTPSRVFTVEGELSLLTAFSQLIAAESYNLDTMQANQAKTDALGSLSHELRSPLHGIILGTELLNDTDLSVFQGNATHTIETCCRTLLDTLDHLLDYAKVNSFATEKQDASSDTSPALRRKADRGSFGKKSLYSNVQLDGLVEEVVESVFAGFNFQHISVKQLSRKQSSAETDADGHGFIDTAQAMEQLVTPTSEVGGGNIEAQLGAVSVYIQVDPTCDWLFQLPTGAVRRIVMNLFGNSLKFTTEGSILVTLSQEKSTSKRGRPKRTVKLTVKDSGKGMSADYIRHRLFRPFAQEDALSPGTGLGLSLVKNIVSSLQGQILVESQESIGTRISVTLPLAYAPANIELSEDDKAFADQVDELKGLRIRLVGFAPPGHGQGTKFNVVEGMCRDTLQLEVIPPDGSEGQDIRPDMVLWMESAVPDSVELIQKHKNTPNVVICQDALAAYRRMNNQESTGHGGVFEFISQPIGPRKLAKSIARAYSRWVGLKKLTGNSDDSIGSRGSHPLSSRSKDSTPTPSGTSSSESLDTGADTSKAEPTPEKTSIEPKLRDVILLVDDNNINLKVLSAFMAKLGRPFALATNGQEAVDVYAKSPESFVGIIMDISMPVMNGFEATRQIRKYEHQEELAATPIMALTGLASHAAQQEALESGVNLFLTKPVRLNQLTEALASLEI